MKIILYLSYRIIDLYLPSQISGAITFDENPDADSKLINIDAIDGKWVIRSTEDTQVIVQQTPVDSYELKVYEDIVLKRRNKYYLIKVDNIYDKTFTTYTYQGSSNLVIGNFSGCNVTYNSNYISNKNVKISIEKNRIILTKTKDLMVYVNKNALTQEETKIETGSMINIYGLKIFITNGIIMINNPLNSVTVDEYSAGLSKLSLNDEKCSNVEIQDIDLYNEKSYFSKSPRIRRIIEPEELNIDKPPSLQEPNETPAILVYGPVLTLAITSTMTLLRTINNLIQGTATLQNSWPSLVSGSVMLISSLVWPNLTKAYTKHTQKVKEAKMITKYDEYLNDKIKELQQISNKQKDILIENLISPVECLQIINRKGLNFWDKRIDQSDLLVARIGHGDEKLKINVNYPEEGFTMDENLIKEKAERVVKEFEYIKDVPIGYSFADYKTTAIMGGAKSHPFIDNIILQFITYYSYEDLKLVIFTNNENSSRWEYVRYLFHCFTNDKNFRMYADDQDSTKLVADFLYNEFNNRMQQQGSGYKPYYFIVIDDLSEIKKHEFLKAVTETDANLGFSVVILEDSMQKLPSKCNNFISLGDKSSGILTNSYDSQEQSTFIDEINYDINMISVSKALANIPIEFAEAQKELPSAITFLEMERVGRVEQLGIMNRWMSNDSTNSLKAEIGVDGNGDLVNLDLHEKYHGPHGLIAGTTGSGKSEFIITYILSMAINYSPDDVAFVLIDYKGGGLAYAFENKTTGVTLPHLAGTITNLDKSEMDRTLTSIDSEVKRRQKLFNEARDKMGESTIDIYKYQRLFKDGKLTEPCPHLFIVCDEFAELKSQQPDFMDNLISIARIGRSLGVHLILATQKPSGVVNDQIWSNTKFRVCLKVQDEGDSREMLKRPEAAYIKEAGRFYLQVGHDEIFTLGQSGWCGAKYFPSDKIIKKVDKSVNFINNNGLFIKSIQAGSSKKSEAEGEQLSAIMKSIIEYAESSNKKAKRLWLDNIPERILADDLNKKYNFTPNADEIKTIIGEYDAPEKQEQGMVDLSLKRDENTVIYGTEISDREMLFKTIIYTMCTNYSPSELNIYVVDYGSGILGINKKFPQVGGIVNGGENDNLESLFNLIEEKIRKRKSLLGELGIDFNTYNVQQKQKNEETFPAILIMINALEVMIEDNIELTDRITKITRDSERYGIYYIINTSGTQGNFRKLFQNFHTNIALRMGDPSLYRDFFGMKNNINPKNNDGRGLILHDIPHEFQTASITMTDEDYTSTIIKTAEELSNKYGNVAEQLQVMPDVVDLNIVESYIKDIKKVPIGISKDTISILKYNFTKYVTTVISSKIMKNMEVFVKSLMTILSKIKNTNTLFIDAENRMSDIKDLANNYYNDNLPETMKKINEFIEQYKDDGSNNILIIIYGLTTLRDKLGQASLLNELLVKTKKKKSIHLVYCDEDRRFKNLEFDDFYRNCKNKNDGIWIGKGFDEQNTLSLGGASYKDLKKSNANNLGYTVKDGEPILFQAIELYEEKVDEDEE